MFQFNDEITILNEWLKTRALHTLVGFESDEVDGTGEDFNFILSNGTRSNQRDEGYTYYDRMMPADAHNKIRSVTIHFHYYNDWIRGFSFFDKDGALLWKIGRTQDGYAKEETVLLADNELIVGVVAKLFSGSQSAYTDF